MWGHRGEMAQWRNGQVGPWPNGATVAKWGSGRAGRAQKRARIHVGCGPVLACQGLSTDQPSMSRAVGVSVAVAGAVTAEAVLAEPLVATGATVAAEALPGAGLLVEVALLGEGAT